jgi:hypothetical protein
MISNARLARALLFLGSRGLREHRFEDFHDGALLGLGQRGQALELLLQLRRGSSLSGRPTVLADQDLDG